MAMDTTAADGSVEAVGGGPDESKAAHIYAAGYAEHSLSKHVRWYDNALARVNPATGAVAQAAAYPGLFSQLRTYSLAVNSLTLNSYALLGGFLPATSNFTVVVGYANTDVGVAFLNTAHELLLALAVEPASGVLVGVAVDTRPDAPPRLRIVTSAGDAPKFGTALEVELKAAPLPHGVADPRGAAAVVAAPGNGTVAFGLVLSPDLYVYWAVDVTSAGNVTSRTLHVDERKAARELHPLWVVHVPKLETFVGYLARNGSSLPPTLAIVDPYTLEIQTPLSSPAIPLVPSMACVGPESSTIHVLSKGVMFDLDAATGTEVATTPINVGNFVFAAAVYAPAVGNGGN
ncbi:uncharacterized protein AMSG_06721 [Thecamonas trahens ATCC 50062]|uniref:Uncharacterized protein n=1 Tax=Thecamonas trahens ATCC 50062 TaxID=461836 RepID=A0A0L0DEQ8_THETB|nr:hypothetical protein AMSG_06721 [Thecamonas trahens ATCC 50062]KNC50817.1 hypothetical protein AMSG_06721 [Thecamonas trahens ATCC 50062]|eukprot:XP_013756772.1 hypothetical protein AMSG_06721 [Thecamonas trahens ATCC 50062]